MQNLQAEKEINQKLLDATRKFWGVDQICVHCLLVLEQNKNAS